MSSMAAGYQLQTFTGMVSHGWPKVGFLRDTTESQIKLTVDAQVRSGDYFVTLATTLDALAKDVGDYRIRAHVEELVSDLIYLQDNYTIVKNDSQCQE